MCLTIIYRGKQKKEALTKLPESGYYWKTVKQRLDGNYAPICNNLPLMKPFKVGWNITKSKYIRAGYRIAFHLHRTKKDAMEWKGEYIRCIIKKKDIVAIGKQWGNLVIVTKRFWMPKPKKKPA